MDKHNNPTRKKSVVPLFLALFFLSMTGPPAMASSTTTSGSNTNSPATNEPSKFFDPQDGWFDVSSFLGTAYGFIPMVVPITEPAVGYGAGGGLVFINRSASAPGQRPPPPSLTAVGGGFTENGTWALFTGSSKWWRDGTIQTKFGLAYADVNLKYYGIGQSPFNGNPVQYTLKPLGGLLEARYRLGQSPWLAGLGYVFATTQVSFNGGIIPPGVNLPTLSSRIGGLKPVIAYDTRNNIFTPTKGIYAEVGSGLYAKALGGDNDYQSVEPEFIFYVPLSAKWTLGVNTSAGFSFGDAPFYARPSINLRGVPIHEYQADDVTQIEGELRWQFWKRFSLIGFAGGGTLWNDSGGERSLASGGTGLRYELARKYGLHMGADVGFSRNCTALYIQFGSAWFRP